jgi:hypothetical protein
MFECGGETSVKLGLKAKRDTGGAGVMCNKIYRVKKFKFGIYLDIIVEYFLRIILYKYIYKINFKIQIDTQIRGNNGCWG